MNESIFYFLHNFANQSPIFDVLVIFFASPFSYLVIFLAILFLLYHHDALPFGGSITETIHKSKETVFVLVTGFSAWFVATLLKLIIATERPEFALPNIFPLFDKGGFAFPSGHATFFFALATSIYIKHKKIGIAFFVAAVVISISRVVAGVHFPIDILGGMLIGVGIAYLLKSV